jgi:hypothetical protein
MSCAKVDFALCLLVICSAALVPASAQHFQQMSGSLSQIAAGRNEVWGLDGSQPYRFNSTNKDFVKISDKVSGPLAQIAVGGGSLLELDQVWAINTSGLVYQYDFTTKAFVYVTGGVECKLCLFDSFSQLVVGMGDEDGADGASDACHPYEVWALQSNLAYQGLPYRYNYCEGEFDEIGLPSGSTTPFTRLATGGSDTWALDANANIWHFSRYFQSWTQITSGGYYGTLQQIVVGVNDVWGLDGNGTVYRYDPNYVTFATVPQVGSYLTQIAAGGDGVWALATSGTFSGIPAVYDPNYNYFPLIDTFTDPPPATQIAVGSGAGVWAVNSSNQVYAFVRP